LRRRLRRRFYAGLAWIILHVAQELPLAWGRRCGVRLSRIAAKVRPRQYELAQDNLARALPELTAHERNSILDASMDNLGQNLFHTLVAPRLLRIPGLVIEEPGEYGDGIGIGERLRDLSGPGRGVIILGGHIGCWELAAGWLAKLIGNEEYGPLAAVTGTIHNPPIDRMVQRWRRKMGMLPLPREDGAGPLVKILKDGGTVGILLDQRTHVRNIEVPFFGHLAPTPVGLAQLALKYSIPVLPADRKSVV